MFVDELTMHAKAGRGGDGVVRWLHEKGKEFGGPAGGNGGNGGDVYIVGSRDIGLLFKHRHKKKWKAEKGEDGGNKSQYGANGADLEIPLPIGSIVKRKDNGQVFEILKDGEKIKILSGGRGGLGNEHFKSSKNINPMQSTPGKPGEESEIQIELQLIADIGFIGLPNAGKSSLLNALTSAKAKVGDFPFTTIDPNLGSLYGIIIADIPGIIEGASDGKGLGHRFLRHIRRTGLLVNCISCESEDLVSDYKTIRKELSLFDESLTKKREIIVLTKTDLISKEDLEKKKKKLEKFGDVLCVSIIDDISLKNMSDFLVKIVRG